jgi:hypothetical protein
MIEVTSRSSSYASIDTHGSNPSFGGYGSDPRVGSLQQQLKGDRQRDAEDRARDTTPDYDQGL